MAEEMATNLRHTVSASIWGMHFSLDSHLENQQDRAERSLDHRKKVSQCALTISDL